jgi:ribosomal protein S12 methylthiotransferase
MRGPLADRISKRRARQRKERLEREQQRITAERMERFTGCSLRVLVEERVEGEELALGRCYLHAPEVDGAAVLLSGETEPGSWVEGRVLRRNTIDLEVEPRYE